MEQVAAFYRFSHELIVGWCGWDHHSEACWARSSKNALLMRCLIAGDIAADLSGFMMQSSDISLRRLSKSIKPQTLIPARDA
jgi:hypothetical protein